MLVEFGASLVLVGHSERRQYNAETSDLVARKGFGSTERRGYSGHLRGRNAGGA